MKRKFYIPLIIIALGLLIICLWPKTNVTGRDGVQLVFVYGDQNIHTALSQEEAARVSDILDGHFCDLSPGEPACGFSENVSLKVDGCTFAPASDCCNLVMELTTGRYFHLPEEDMDYLHELFRQYGGDFPCV